MHSVNHLLEIFDSNNIYSDHFPAAAQSLRPGWKNLFQSGFALFLFSPLFSHMERKTTALQQRRQRTELMEWDVSHSASKLLIYSRHVCAAPWSNAIDWVMNKAESMSGDLQQDLMLINVLEQWAAKVQLSAGHAPSLTTLWGLAFTST